MKQFLYLYLLLLFLFTTGFVNAQKIETSSPVSDKKGILLRPNSRDYGSNQRDNSYQRVENKRDGTNVQPGLVIPGHPVA